MSNTAGTRSPVEPRTALAGVLSSLVSSPAKQTPRAHGKSIFPFLGGPTSLNCPNSLDVVVLGRHAVADSLRVDYEVHWVVSPTAIAGALEGMSPNFLVIDEGWLFDGPWARYVLSDGSAAGALADAVSLARSRRAIIYVWAPEERADGRSLNIAGARYLPNIDASKRSQSKWAISRLATSLQNMGANEQARG